MPTFTAGQLKEIGTRLFRACGASEEEAAVVAGELVEASLMGLDSHGVMRFAMYVEQALDGTIRPGAEARIVRETPTTAVVDCGGNFGIVSGLRMVEIVAEKAVSMGIAASVSVRCNHAGRLGCFANKLAERGMFGFASANSSRQGHFVSPWGGREGRLATNPLAWAVPTGEDPIVMDMSTSMIAEGRIRILMQQGQPLPEGCILDGEGNPSTDPRRFYGPPKGTILPFGSPRLGYKGFGLGLLVEILGSALAGVPLTPEDQKDPYVNGLFIMAIDPEAFCGRELFRRLVAELGDYIRSSKPAPGSDGVFLPGALDFKTRRMRLRDGIPVAEETWKLIRETAAKVGVEL